jgi:sulfate transport system permease protein
MDCEVKMSQVQSIAVRDSNWVRFACIGFTLVFIGITLIAPLVLVFKEAFAEGWGAWWAAITETDALAAIRLSLLVAVFAVPINTIFGVAAAWLIARFQFRGRQGLLTLIDLPFSVSPVVAGLIYVLVFGAQGWMGPWLEERGWQVIYTPIGITLATLFVTFPFVARELIPLMQAQGSEEEQASLVLGASGWRTFWRITLPNLKWALLYGILLCNARALGEFGAVSVVSGHIRGVTNTLPLHVEVLYNEYQTQPAFACASLLAFVGLLTLLLKTLLELKIKRERALAARREG